MADADDLDMLDHPSATPLDLLLNAIGSSREYAFGRDTEGGGDGDGEGVGGGGGAGDGSGGGDGADGSGGDGPLGFLHAGVDGAQGRKRAREDDGSPRLSKISRTLASHFGVRDAAAASASGSASGAGAPVQPIFSTVEVWHPRTGQKSYGKERRILQPPPTLWVTGPLHPQVTTMTLSALRDGDTPDGRVTFSQQTHRMRRDSGDASGAGPAGASVESEVGRGKKVVRDEKRRQMREAAARTGWGRTLPWERARLDLRDRADLVDGITFPGLWVGEDTGKTKEFRLELTVGEPGVETNSDGGVIPHEAQVAVPPAVLPEAHAEPQLHLEPHDAEPTQPIDEAALRRVLGNAMDPVINLAEVEADTAEPDATKRLVETLQLAADSGSLDAGPLPSDTPATDAFNTPLEPIPAEPEPASASNLIDAAASTAVTPPTPSPPWATFVSDPLSIVSKPSQKTAKARSMASCLSRNDPFALYVRINAQTVRTKFMKLDNTDTAAPVLAARVGKWTPFRFDVLHRAPPPESEDKTARARFKVEVDREADVVTYGSIVRLVDVSSGAASDPCRLVRVDKNEVVVGADYGHPVSELQRVGLVRVVDGEDDMEGGARWYLSAPGAIAGAGEVATTRARPTPKSKATPVAAAATETTTPDQPGSLPETLNGVEGLQPSTPTTADSTVRPTRKKKTKRHALARAAINEEEEGSTSATVVWSPAQRREGEYVVVENKVSTRRAATIETVDDWMCWILGGVRCFSYSFFNGLGTSGSLPKTALDPVPRLLIDPVFHEGQGTLDLTLSHFFVEADGDAGSGTAQPLSVYLGPIGPLRTTTWRSVAPKEKYYDPGALYPAQPYNGTGIDTPPVPDSKRVYSNYPHSAPHVIAMVELPGADEIARVMHEMQAWSQSQPQGHEQEHAQPTADEPPAAVLEPPPEEDSTWLGVMGPAGELTIQEALRNAGKEHAPEHDVAAVLGAHALPKVPADGAGGEFELGQLGDTLIDPTLASVAAAAAAQQPDPQADLAQAPDQAPAPAPTQQHTTLATISMHRPEHSDAPASLPLLLVRPDGVGHGLGWSMVATPTSAAASASASVADGSATLAPTDPAVDPTEASWAGLRLVQTNVRGRGLSCQ